MAVRKILIVEDQALARTYLCSCVEKCRNCEVAGTLSKADAALYRCGEGHIDLILTVTPLVFALSNSFFFAGRRIASRKAMAFSHS